MCVCVRARLSYVNNFKPEFIFLSELNECLSSPCQHGGTCQKQTGGYACKCQEGYVGAICNIGIVIQNKIAYFTASSVGTKSPC